MNNNNTEDKQKSSFIIPGKSDIKESAPDIAAGMVSKNGIVDYTDNNGVESKRIIGRKMEGVDPGLLFDNPPGMTKFGKNLLSQVKPANHDTILGELLGIGISRLFLGASSASDMKLGLVKMSIDQLRNTPEKGKLAEYKNEKTIIVPALSVNFNKKAKKLGDAKAIAAIHKNLCSGYTQPVLENMSPNMILGHDFGLFGMLNFLFQDPDSMGKEGQNKMLLNFDLFIIDSGLKKADTIELREDGRLFNSYYKQFNSDSKLGWGRHLAFRNLSMIDDTPFIDKLQGAIQIINRRDEILKLLDNFVKEIEELKKEVEEGSDCYKILQGYQETVNDYKLIVNRRIDSLENNFKYYIDIEKRDKNLPAAVVALEHLLSKSTRMYSREGVPLRAVEIPYQDHFFCRGKLDLSPDNKEIIIKNLTQTETRAVFEKMKLLLGDKVKLNNQTISCTKEDFIKYVTEDRVRLVTHPETVSLKTVLLDENKDIKSSYFNNYQKLLDSFPQLRSKLNVFFQYYNLKPKDSKDLINNFKVLKQVFIQIDAALPKDLLTRTTADSNNDWGSLVALKAILTKKQQMILNEIFQEIKVNGKLISMADLFAHADRLDISDKLNKLLDRALDNPDLLNNNLFNTALSAIIVTSETSKDAGQSYEDFKRKVFEIDALMTDLLTLNPKKPAAKIPLGIKDPGSQTSAKENISLSIRAVSQGRINIYSDSSRGKTSSPVGQTEKTTERPGLTTT